MSQPLLFEASVPVKRKMKKVPPQTVARSVVTQEPALPDSTKAIIEAITRQQEATFNQVLELHKRENEELKNLLREERDQVKRSASEASSSSAKKAKTIREPALSDESWWTKGTFEIRDNQTDILALSLRTKLGAINADPKKWVPQIAETVTMPRRGSSLYTGEPGLMMTNGH